MAKGRKLTPLGEWIEHYLEQHTMSLRALADRMDYSHAQLSRVKYGSVKPSPRLIRSLSYATGAPENELLIIAFGQPRVDTARLGARRIINLSSGTQEALRGIAAIIAQLTPDDQLLAIDWFRALAKMSQSDRTKAIREITAYLKQ